MLYNLYELNQAALSPARAAAEACRLLFRNPLNPASHTPLGRGAAAALELFERTTRRYRKPAWEYPHHHGGRARGRCADAPSDR